MRVLFVLLSVLVLAGCGEGDEGEGPTVVAGLYPLAWAAEQVAGDEVSRRRRHPAGRGAARRRALASRRGDPPGRRARRLRGRLPAGGRRRDLGSGRTVPRRPRWRARCTRVARPRALRSRGSGDRRGSRASRARAGARAAARDPRPGLLGGSRTMRPAHSRHQPCRLRASRRPLRPYAAVSRRSLARGGAGAEGPRAAGRGSTRIGSDDGLLGAARLGPARADRCARGGPRRSPSSTRSRGCRRSGPTRARTT